MPCVASRSLPIGRRTKHTGRHWPTGFAWANQRTTHPACLEARLWWRFGSARVVIGWTCCEWRAAGRRVEVRVPGGWERGRCPHESRSWNARCACLDRSLRSLTSLFVYIFTSLSPAFPGERAEKKKLLKLSWTAFFFQREEIRRQTPTHRTGSPVHAASPGQSEIEERPRAAFKDNTSQLSPSSFYTTKSAVFFIFYQNKSLFFLDKDFRMWALVRSSLYWWERLMWNRGLFLTMCSQ